MSFSQHLLSHLCLYIYLFKFSYRKYHYMKNEAAREMTNGEAIGGILVNVITVFMLLWGIYTGIRLAMEPRGDSKYHFLTFSIGVITIVFGCLYFIFGLAITMELALDLSSRLQQKEKKGSSIHKGHNKNVKCFV